MGKGSCGKYLATTVGRGSDRFLRLKLKKPPNRDWSPAMDPRIAETAA